MALIRKIYRNIKNRVLRLYLLIVKGPVGYARHLGVTVGNGCRLYITEFGSEPFLISIGDKVTITAGVRLLTHNGSTWLVSDERGRRNDFKGIKIGDNVFIGVDSIIMPGVWIENEVVIAAGSVVTKSIPTGSIVGGNPARIIGYYNDYFNRSLESLPAIMDRPAGISYKEAVKREMNVEPKPMMKRK